MYTYIYIYIYIFKGLRPAADPWENQKVSKSLRSWMAVSCIHVRLCIRILAWSKSDRWVVNSCNIWSVWFSFAWYSATYLFFGRWPVTCKCNRSSLMLLKVSWYSVWFWMVLIGFIWFSFLFLWFSIGFVTPRASWGSWRALGELWGVSGAPRVGFGTFWGDLGGSLGGVQSSLLGGKYVTNTEVLELGRFSVTWRAVWILFVFSLFFGVWFLWIGEVNSL